MVAAESGADRGVEVRDVPDRGQYEARVRGELAGLVQYHRFTDSVALMHTEVLPAFEGRGIGGALMRAVLDDLRAQGLPVRPHCEYAKAWIARHPEYAGLVAP